jgi:hypothetical protein
MVCSVRLAEEAGAEPPQDIALKIPTILRDPDREPRLDNPYWPLGQAERQRQQEMWHSEVDLLARAQGSPYVTRLVGVVLDERTGHPEFILTELAAGSLYATLHDDKDADGGDGPRGGRSVSEDEATWMMLNIARGLQHLHECDPPITHRDLSAKNVLRVRGSCLLALTDLGQAKALRGRGTDTLNPGAEVYAAPESLVEGVDQSVQMDIFSFGVLALEICTGFFPRPGVEYEAVGGGLARKRTQLERRAEHLGLMEDANLLKPTVVWCLAENPVERPFAADVVRELRAPGAAAQIQEAQAALVQAQATLEAGQAAQAAAAEAGQAAQAALVQARAEAAQATQVAQAALVQARAEAAQATQVAQAALVHAQVAAAEAGQAAQAELAQARAEAAQAAQVAQATEAQLEAQLAQAVQAIGSTVLSAAAAGGFDD